jgi:hypothetical protein
MVGSAIANTFFNVSIGTIRAMRRLRRRRQSSCVSGRLLLPKIDRAPLNHGSPGHGKSGAGRREFGSAPPVPPALIQSAP